MKIIALISCLLFTSALTTNAQAVSGVGSSGLGDMLSFIASFIEQALDLLVLPVQILVRSASSPKEQIAGKSVTRPPVIKPPVTQQPVPEIPQTIDDARRIILAEFPLHPQEINQLLDAETMQLNLDAANLNEAQKAARVLERTRALAAEM